MDAYEATRIVFSRIQNLDPDNGAKIMGLLLIQDYGEKEMIRLAFGPEALLQSIVIKARKDLGLLSFSTPVTPGASVFSHKNTARLLPASQSSWGGPVPPFSRIGSISTTAVDDLPSPKELLVPTPEAAPFYGPGDLIDELQIQEQLPFLNDGSGAKIGPNGREIFFPDIAGDFRSPTGGVDMQLFPSSMGWASPNGHNQRLRGSFDELYLGSDSSCVGLGWRPCLYNARGFCKNGNTCRFHHDEASAATAVAGGCGKTETSVEQELLLMRSKTSRLMASAPPFPYSASVPPPPLSPSTKYMNCLLQHHNGSQRAAALMLNGSGGDDMNNFMGQPRMERAEFAGMLNPGSRQIYLTFPADSTFREEDVSNYFSIYGPVQDVRIPYQQKRMFGFVTFIYPETVKLILAKGNPHFVCDSRVLVKPYKEKGKVPDKYRKQLAERVDFFDNSAPIGLESPLELGERLFYGGGQDVSLLRRRLEEQQQAELMQEAIELQGRRFQLMDLKTRNLSSNPAAAFSPAISSCLSSGVPFQKLSQQEDKRAGHGFGTEMQQQRSVNNAGEKQESAEEMSPKEDGDFQECSEHNLPDSPFASPTKSSSAVGIPGGACNHFIGPPLLPPSSTLNSCFFQMPARFSDHGAVGM